MRWFRQRRYVFFARNCVEFCSMETIEDANLVLSPKIKKEKVRHQETIKLTLDANKC